MKKIFIPTISTLIPKGLSSLLKPALLMLVLMVFSVSGGWAQPVHWLTTSKHEISNTAIVTVSHDLSPFSGENRLMLVGVSTRNRTITVGNAGEEVSTVTFDGDPLIYVGRESDNTDAFTYLFMMVDPPLVNASVQVTFSSVLNNKDNAGIVGISTFSNVDKVNPLLASGNATFPNLFLSFGNNTAPTLTVGNVANPTKTSQVVFNVLAVGDDVTMPITLNSSQDRRWEIGGSALDIRPTGGGYSKTGTTGTTPMSYTLSTSRRWSLIGVAINAMPMADLAITKTVNFPGPYAGQTIQFTLTATNNGPDNATLVEVYDLLPSGYTYVSHTSPAGTTYNVGAGIWEIGNLNSDQSLQLTINAVVNASGNYTNTATISGNVQDNTPGNNTASVYIILCQAGGTQPLFNQ